MTEKTLDELQLDAVMLHGLLQGLEVLIEQIDSVPSAASNSAVALSGEAVEKADRLANELDLLSMRRNAA